MRRMIFLCSVAALCLAVQACSDPEREVPLLMKQLRSAQSKERSQAALKLGRIGPPHANAATRDLVRLLRDPNPGVQSSAAYALRKIDSAEARRALEAATKARSSR